MTDKQIYQIGLTMINGVGDILARHLLEALGMRRPCLRKSASR